MVDTTAQVAAARWIVENGLKPHFPEVDFEPREVDLRWGGAVQLNAVSQVRLIAGYVTTANLRTASNKIGTAKIHRLRAEALFLSNLRLPFTLFISVTEQSMRDHMLHEQEIGRFPNNIELIYVELPEDHQESVARARSVASTETSPP